MVPGPAGRGPGENEEYRQDGRHQAGHRDNQRKARLPDCQVGGRMYEEAVFRTPVTSSEKKVKTQLIIFS